MNKNATNLCAFGRRLMPGLLCLALCIAQCRPTAAASSFPANVFAEMNYDWKDEHGASVRLSDWSGKTALLTMAYPTCRRTCSYTLHRLEELQESADRVGTPIEVIVVSYDPGAGAGAWSAYRHHHDIHRANWHFLTGSSATTRQFAKALQFPYWLMDDHVVHDFKILMIGADGRIVNALTWESRNEDLFAAAASCSSPDERGCKP